MEKDFCKKCGNCCSCIKIDLREKIMYRNGIENIDDEFLSLLEKFDEIDNITYFRCKYLQNNLCTNLNKPTICEEYPSSPFAYLPENCGYDGIIFQKKEVIMQKIRKLKEEIIHYEALAATAKNKSEKQQYIRIIDSHNKFVKKYEKYGAEDW